MADLKRWQRVASIAGALRMVEQRIDSGRRKGRDVSILVHVADRIRGALTQERLKWEGVIDDTHA